MFIRMAIDAKCKLHLELRVVPRRNVTRGALHGRMRKSEREAGLRMIDNRERRRTPALNRMAAFATSAVGTLRKLAAVWIGLVAISTGIVRDRRLEVSTLVTA